MLGTLPLWRRSRSSGARKSASCQLHIRASQGRGFEQGYSSFADIYMGNVSSTTDENSAEATLTADLKRIESEKKRTVFEQENLVGREQHVDSVVEVRRVFGAVRVS